MQNCMLRPDLVGMSPTNWGERVTGSDRLAFTGVVLAALIGVTIPIHGLIESRRRQAERAKTAEKAHEVALEILSQRTSDKELDYQHLSDKLGVIVFAKQSLPTVFAPLFFEIEALS
jgi:hypothetical protein